MEVIKAINALGVGQYIMLIGHPAAGKSTFAKRFNDHHTGDKVLVMSRDTVIEEVAENFGISYVDAFQPKYSNVMARANKLFNERLEDAKTALSNKALNYLVHDQIEILDPTAEETDRSVRIEGLPEHIIKTAIFFKLSEEEMRARLDRRSENSEKKISFEIGKALRDRIKDPTLEEGFDNILKGPQNQLECGNFINDTMELCESQEIVYTLDF